MVSLKFHSWRSVIYWKLYSRGVQYLGNLSPEAKVSYFFFPGKVTFSMKSGKKEWVSKISGIFFFRFRGKKNTALFFINKKIPPYFCQNCQPHIFAKTVDFKRKKTQPIFTKTDDFSRNKKIPPYFLQNCQFPRK